MLLPQRSYGSTLKNHMLFITNSTTAASQTLLALSTLLWSMHSAQHLVARQLKLRQLKLEKVCCYMGTHYLQHSVLTHGAVCARARALCHV